MSNPCIYLEGGGTTLPNAWVDGNGKPCYPAPGYSNGQGVAQNPPPSGYITDPNPPNRSAGNPNSLPMVNGSGQPIGGATATATPFSSKTLIFLGGIAVVLFLGGTKFSPVVVAFLAATLVFWALNPFKKGG